MPQGGSTHFLRTAANHNGEHHRQKVCSTAFSCLLGATIFVLHYPLITVLHSSMWPKCLSCTKRASAIKSNRKRLAFRTCGVESNLYRSLRCVQIEPKLFESIVSFDASLSFQLIVQNDEKYIICHHDDNNYKFKSHVVMLLLDSMTADSLGKKSVPMSQLIDLCFEKFREEINDSLVESMNHLIDTKTENNKQMVSLSKLAVFLLSIVNTMKLVPSITVAELRAKINSKINLTNACFEIGNYFVLLCLVSFSFFFLVVEIETLKRTIFSCR